MTTLEVSPRRKHTPVSKPIPLLPTDAARLYTHIHPTLVLAYYYVRFPALVVDPIPTLLRDLIPLTIFQCAYSATCLPPNGFGNGKFPPQQKSGKAGGRSKRVTSKQSNDVFPKIFVGSELLTLPLRTQLILIPRRL